MALNMPKDMYDAIKGDLPRVWKKMLLPIANRHPTNAITGKAIGETNSKERTEVIYVWKKLRTQTRKLKK
jgi:hypothetical protein